jgi:hypothetical protein
MRIIIYVGNTLDIVRFICARAFDAFLQAALQARLE